MFWCMLYRCVVMSSGCYLLVSGNSAVGVVMLNVLYGLLFSRQHLWFVISCCWCQYVTLLCQSLTVEIRHVSITRRPVQVRVMSCILLINAHSIRNYCCSSSHWRSLQLLQTVNHDLCGIIEISRFVRWTYYACWQMNEHWLKPLGSSDLFSLFELHRMLPFLW